MRASLLPLLVPVAVACPAQDWDLYIQGTVIDARTQAPIAYAQADVFDEFDTSSDKYSMADGHGAFSVGLYTWDSSYYVLEFSAEGYVTRRAVIDVTGVDPELDADMAWRIDMNVPLQASAYSDARTDTLLGYCTYEQAGRTLRWSSAAARKAFPVERYHEPRIAAHAALMDSLDAAEGTVLMGNVNDQWDQRPLEGVWVSIIGNDGTERHVLTDIYGFYAVVLPYDDRYTIRFGRQDRVTKTVVVDNSGIPDEARVNGFRAQVDIRLFAPLTGEDLAFLEEPIGRAQYDPLSGTLAWDIALTSSIMQRLDAILLRHASGR
ncbi:MAG TPA: hypothetical protein VGE21_12805 [Flavobacteriales bacterium]